ncbi:uncharacterized protein LOC107266936 [Cephus cinctus]|uniref:Uncharacterized protein LOC107266936 n=1 Tax=Cephus cinctus TaxID=211228 RepID=A0AAJ7FII0_CEPCN|nr:uncharacterized protein LOC107266936 [Cephus cinctus]
MKTLLYLAIIVICQMEKISSGLVYPHFPNLKTIYHGHGATSYQNVEIQHHGDVPVPVKSRVNHGYIRNLSGYPDYNGDHKLSYVTAIPITDYQDIDSQFVLSSAAPFADSGVHIEFGKDSVPNYYDNYDFHQEYEYH